MHIEEIAKLIVERRNLLGIDQRSLAELAGISTRALSAIETGQGNPTLAHLNDVLSCLGLELQVVIRQASPPVQA